MGLSVRTRAGTAGVGLVALVLAGGAVGCGSEKSLDMEPAAAVAKAAKNTEEIKSLNYRMAGEIPGEGEIEGTASMSLDPVAMSMKMELAPGGTSAPEGGEVEIRLLDNAMFVNGGEQAAEELDGKSWIKFDMAALGADDELSQLGGAGQADQNPTSEAGFLTGAKDVEEVGTETVDGVQTTHYKGEVSLADLRASLKDEDEKTREAREKSLEQYEDMGVDQLTMDLWVDADERTKQFRMRGDAEQGPLDLTITFLDINKPVEIKAPPAGETMDLAEMMNDLEPTA
ncbi:DUF1396 domain-containing protein [Streptomyces sp. NPDC059477]|uniref:DUF1396 domain-containing protein n=1 Tax=Streptomyces sp. NPDC059477 TaxID=3346847 RepID=UPI003695090D